MPWTERRLVYIIDAPATWQSVGIVAELAAEHRRLDGSWDAPAIVPDSTFELRGASIATTLRRVCQAGGCRVRTVPGEIPATALVWDDGPPWRLKVHVAREESERYLVTASLHRDDEEMPIAEPELVHSDGWVVARGAVARFDYAGAFAIAALFRNAGSLSLDREELSEFLIGFDALPSVPPIDLPHGSPITELHAPPVPRLEVAPGDDWDRKIRGLVAGFDYGPIRITGSEPAASLYDASTRTVHHRDFAAEAAVLQRLASHGAKNEWVGDSGERRMVIPARRLGALVAEAVRNGWHVEAEGGSYRTAGPARVTIRSGIDWFELAAGVRYGDIEVGLNQLLEAMHSGSTSILLSDGTHGVLPLEWLARLGPLAAGGRAVGGVLRYRQSQVALLDALLTTLPEADVDATFERARAELRSFDRVAPSDAGPDFTGALRSYQQEGLGWLDFLRRFGLGGCLADDMGLGKTVQVLAMLDRRRAPSGEPGRPSIVVVPRSLVFNWVREAARFTPRLRVLDYSGPARQASDIRPDQTDVVITTYGTLRRDAAELAAIQFDYAILDEAQAIKNPASASAKAARLLRADHRLAMTGTPIENRLEELWSLFEFLNPGMLGSATGFSELVRLAELEDPAAGASRPGHDLLARALRPVVLRRRKEDVARDLPPRTEQTLGVVLEGEQRAFYDALLVSYRRSVFERIERVGIGGARMHILEALLRLRQAACHPGLVDARARDAPSAKLEALLPRLEEVAEQGHKALVFSQFTSFLALARTRLEAAGIPYEYLDGQVRDRQARVDRFQADVACPLFLISLKAGGHGLNLTAADYVYLLDPWWNPAVEAQAIDRAHRIGQTRSVIATRLVARDTIEEKILRLQDAKRALADAILGGEEGGLAGIGKEELEMLFR